MRHIKSYILAALAFATLSCNKGPKIIPAAEFASIYAEMFLYDAYIEDRGAAARQADTTRVYAAVFQKYGYTEEDFKATQMKYFADGVRHQRVLAKANDILEDNLKKLKAEKAERKAQREKKEKMMEFAPKKILYLSGLDCENCLKMDSLSYCIDTSSEAKWNFPLPEMLDNYVEKPSSESDDEDDSLQSSDDDETLKQNM